MKYDEIVYQRLNEKLGLVANSANIVVVGLGVTGLSVARYLRLLGFTFAIADSREQPAGLPQLQEEFVGVPIFTGKFNEDLFCQASHLIVSPGIPLTDPAIKKALQHGVNVLGDIDLFACSISAPTVAITGSNGKSTVTTMVGDMAQAAGKKTAVGGNLGLAALDLLADDIDVYVLELSSFQLERTNQLNAAAATVLNLSADHLDRHHDMTDYAAQKQRIFRGDGVMIINIDDPIVAAMQETGRGMLTFSIQSRADFWLGKVENAEYLMHHENILMPVSELPLEGRHNAANALAALALGTAIGLDTKAMCQALKSFKGLRHRMEKVAEVNGVNWVNDSKATNIGACVAALMGYDQKVILIAGGDGKGADMHELVPSVKTKAKYVVLMGKDAELIEIALAGCVPSARVANMLEAVNVAAKVADNGDTVLLSPACASLDQYKNYQDRGDQFVAAIHNLKMHKNGYSSSVLQVM